MSRQRIPSAIAALFSLVIVFGAWFLTRGLLERQHFDLMNAVHSIDVREPAQSGQRAEPAKVSLSAGEIASILRVWRPDQPQHYHEPTADQLTMEDAIDAAKSGLSWFCQSGILPEAIFEGDFTSTSAFLYDALPIKAGPVSVSPAPDPAYSFWTVNLSNREVSAALTLNAETGQVWLADISSSTPDVSIDAKPLDVLKQYEAYLGISGGGGLKSDEQYASKTYGDNQFALTVQVRSGASGYGFVRMALTTPK